jgi:membrane protease YdiL (CAAX protease family)
MTKNNAKKQAITYLIIIFLFSLPWYVLISLNGGLAGGGQGYVGILMWMPALAGLLTAFIYQRNLRGMGWGLGKPKYYLIAYLLPLLYAGIAYGLVWLLGLGAVQPGAMGENWPLMSVFYLTIGIVLSALLAVGEEIGWRGLLVPQLAKFNSFTRTVLISGVIWGLWHVPMIIGGGYSSGAPTWWAIACFMVLIVGVSFAFAWLRLASGSIWPAVLLHAVHNTFIQSILDEMTIDTGHTPYFTTEFGLALAVMGIIVGVVFWRQGQRLNLPERR